VVEQQDAPDTRSGQEHLVNGRYPTYIIDNYDQINNYLDDADWLFVQTAGDYILDFDHLWTKIHSIPDYVGLVGHLIWDQGEFTPYLEEQCFIINTKAVKHLDFNSYIETGKNFIRSEDDLHEGHAPLWLALGDRTEIRHGKFGTKLMSDILENDYSVVNFDQSWRYSDTIKLPIRQNPLIEQLPTRGYLYPYIKTVAFSEALKSLKSSDYLDPAQQIALSVINETMKFNYINALYWDDIVKDYDCDLVIAPANGLMAETLAYYNHAKKIVIYDINPNNIEFKKFLYENFDGHDYEQFYKKYAKERNLKIEPNHTVAITDEIKYHNREVLANWDKIKKIEKTYISGDLFTTLPWILPLISSKTIIHTSTILGYYIFSNILHDQEEIDMRVSELSAVIESTGAVWLGER